MSKKKHIWCFFTEATLKYEVCVYENDSYENFLDENIEKIRGDEDLSV